MKERYMARVGARETGKGFPEDVILGWRFTGWIGILQVKGYHPAGTAYAKALWQEGT